MGLRLGLRRGLGRGLRGLTLEVSLSRASCASFLSSSVFRSRSLHTHSRATSRAWNSKGGGAAAHQKGKRKNTGKLL